MVSTLQFVDGIGGSVRLDLNALGAIMLANAYDFSPPPLRRVETDSPMRDGSELAGSAYGNRTIRLPLHLLGAADRDALNALRSPLMRELDRPTNWLKWQPAGATSARYFFTHRADAREVNARLTDHLGSYELDIPAFPFAFGARVDLSAVTVKTDPALTPNGMCFDVTGVPGDVATPAILSFPPTEFLGAEQTNTVLMSTRRHGTPADLPFFVQAEAMTTLGADTTVEASAGASGGSRLKTTFATTPIMNLRARTTWPTAMTAARRLAWRGTYRVLALIHSTTGSPPALNLQMGYRQAGSWTDFLGPIVPTSTSLAGPKYVDLGLLDVPIGGDGQDSTTGASEIDISIYAQRPSGSDFLYIDHLMFLPADTEMALVELFDVSSSASAIVIDGHALATYATDAGGASMGSRGLTHLGGLPMLSPGVTTRVFFVLHGPRSVKPVDITDTVPVTVSYYPRYLSV